MAITWSTLTSHLPRPPWESPSPLSVSAWTISIFAAGAVLLSKKVLPKWTWGPLSRFYFWPLVLPTFVVRSASGPYWAEVGAQSAPCNFESGPESCGYAHRLLNEAWCVRPPCAAV